MTDQHTRPSSPDLLPPSDATAPATEPTSAPATSLPPQFLRRKRIGLPMSVLLLFVVIMIATGGNNPRVFDFTRSGAPSTYKSALTAPPASALVGQGVRDGSLAFTVTSVQRPGKTLKSRTGTLLTTVGEFVIVRVNVTNIGLAPRTLTATSQFLLDDVGQRFATSAAVSSLPGAETVFLKKIEPDQTVSAAPLLFDVPPGSSIASIELHDSLTSTGVKVKLPAADK